jgi:hypothetical protein
LLFGYASVQYSVKSGTNGFNIRQTAGGNMSEDMIVSMIGTYAATFTQTASGTWAGLIATFKAAPSVPPPTLQSITATPVDPTMAIGGSPLQLAASGTFSDSSQQNVTSSCSWSSSATGVATVNSVGRATGVTTGSANVTCTVDSVSGFTTVTVTSALTAKHYLQSANSVSNTNSTAVSASLTKLTTAGNAIVVAVSTSGPAISTVRDTQGNTFVRAVGSGKDSIWYATNIHGGADMVTANFASSADFSLLYIHEYAGIAASLALDQVSSQSGTGTSVTSGAKTITQGNELVFGYAAVDHRVSGAGTGFTARQTAGGNMSADMIVPSAGTYAATFTQSFSGGWTALLATFR